MSNGRKKLARAAWLMLAATAAGGGCQTAPAPDGAPLAAEVTRGPWRFADIPGQELTTDHYRIFTTVTDRSVLSRLPGFLERALEQYRELTGLALAGEPGRRMPVYLLATRRQWAGMTRRVTGPRSRLYLSIENGGYHYRGACVFWNVSTLATFSLAAHEGCHQFLHHARLRDPLPASIEEGLCSLAEGFVLTGSTVRFLPERNVLRQSDLRRALSAGRVLPLKRLIAADAGDHILARPELTAEYYGQLWALMLFVRSEPAYRAGLGRMIADAAAGRLRAALHVPAGLGTGRTYSRAIALPAFRHYIEADLGRFEKGYRAFARKLARLD